MLLEATHTLLTRSYTIRTMPGFLFCEQSVAYVGSIPLRYQFGMLQTQIGAGDGGRHVRGVAKVMYLVRYFKQLLITSGTVRCIDWLAFRRSSRYGTIWFYLGVLWNTLIERWSAVASSWSGTVQYGAVRFHFKNILAPPLA